VGPITYGSCEIAQGSLKELETHVILAQRVGLMSPEVQDGLLELADRISRMLRAMIRSLAK
jgi:four helix bundle protein